MSFWIVVSVLLAGTVLYVSVSARRARLRAEGTSAAAHYAERAEELAGDVAAGTIDAAQADALNAEIARHALREAPEAPVLKSPQGRRSAFVLLVALLPLIAIPLYLSLGSPGLLDPAVSQAASTANEHMSMSQMVDQLQQRIDANPDDPEARMWMARVMMATEQYGQAVDQYEKVLGIVGDQPDVLVQYADALAMVNGGRMAGKPVELVERALAADPKHIMALWLAGLAAQEAGDVPKARSLLQRARAASLAAHQPTDELDAQLAALDGKAPPASASSTTPPATASPTPDAAADGPRIEVAVAVAPALAAQVDADATLFVVAKMTAGMPMPLAVQRVPAKDLPLTVTLDDSLAMAPTATLSSASEVEIIARISRSGQAIAATGDLEGRISPVAVGGTQRVTVTIDRVVP